jgi:hypothetical protein
MTNFFDDFDTQIQPEEIFNEDLFDDNQIDEDYEKSWLDEDHLYDETNESNRWRTTSDDDDE